MENPHIFYAGPSLLPKPVYDEAAAAVKDFAGTGVSVLSTGHRTAGWGAVMDETRSLWRELLDIPEDYEILFLAGGASMEFLRIPMNFLERKAAYLDTGVWARKALNEAQGIGDAYAVASSADRNYNYVPKGFDIPEDLDYLHVTTNNTVYGTQMHEDLDSPVPLIADMSSDILSRPVDVGRYAVIYGGAQKNAGTAGVSFVIVRRNLLGRVSRRIPTLLDYREHVQKASMSNTPPVFSIFVMNRTLHWIKSRGGVKELQKENILKAEALYGEIDRNPMFVGTADRQDRSLMNVRFVMAPGKESLEAEFLSAAETAGIIGIKGHRSVGGLRASIYNACTAQDVDALVKCMKEFEEKHRW